MKLIIIDGQIAGTTTADDRNNYTLIDPPQGWDGDLTVLVFDPKTQAAAVSLGAYRAKCAIEIKAQAAQLIDALAWRMERAQEREMLGVEGEKVKDVLREREAIRRASNRVEAEINAALDAQSVRAVTFTVSDADNAKLVRKILQCSTMTEV